MSGEGLRFTINPEDIDRSAERTANVAEDYDLWAVSIRERLKVIQEKNKKLVAAWGHYSKKFDLVNPVTFFGTTIFTYDMLPADLQELDMFEEDKKYLERMEQLHLATSEGGYRENVRWFFDELPDDAIFFKNIILTYKEEVDAETRDDFLIGAAYGVAPAFLVLQGRASEIGVGG